MTIEQELIRMQQKGILTPEEYLAALNKIRAQERKTSLAGNPELTKKRVLFSIAILGIFSVLAGLGLIIAANWAVIPAIVKVGGGLAVLVTSLVITSQFQKNNKPLWMEAFLF
jgi:uncharacterized membrane protein